MSTKTSPTTRRQRDHIKYVVSIRKRPLTFGITTDFDSMVEKRSKTGSKKVIIAKVGKRCSQESAERWLDEMKNSMRR